MTESAPVLVIDSSVAYKWFDAEGESHVTAALELLEAHARRDVVLVAPAHMVAEVLNALRNSGLPESALRQVPSALADAGVLALPIDRTLAEEALSIALECDLTVHDALFAALAVQLECELVTADRRQARVRRCPVRLLL